MRFLCPKVCRFLRSSRRETRFVLYRRKEEVRRYAVWGPVWSPDPPLLTNTSTDPRVYLREVGITPSSTLN